MTLYCIQLRLSGVATCRRKIFEAINDSESDIDHAEPFARVDRIQSYSVSLRDSLFEESQTLLNKDK